MPGDSGLGTLTMSSLSLGSGSVLDYQFNGYGNGTINVTSPNGLTINGGGINMNIPGTWALFRNSRDLQAYQLFRNDRRRGNLGAVNPEQASKHGI